MKVTQNEIDQVEFDLDALTAGDIAEMTDAEGRSDLRTSASLIAKVVTRCPWGEANDPQTYLKLPIRLYLALSRRLGRLISAETEAEKK